MLMRIVVAKKKGARCARGNRAHIQFTWCARDVEEVGSEAHRQTSRVCRQRETGQNRQLLAQSLDNACPATARVVCRLRGMSKKLAAKLTDKLREFADKGKQARTVSCWHRA